MDRNLLCRLVVGSLITSLSARRAWIEIMLFLLFRLVAGVALRKESVDRNIVIISSKTVARVALRKESVDRNHVCIVTGRLLQQSLSARRAWIEIHLARNGADNGNVALRKESVDRNSTDKRTGNVKLTSLSARRAWIEITAT